jgi:pimeloyl-ACP methyl ester carboxylesterase
MDRAQVNGVNLHHRISGQGVPILLIHGLGSSLRDWEEQVSKLSESYRVITVDLRGHGHSEKPEGPYHMTDFAADVAALLRHLDAVPAHIVGLSLGGMIAFQLAVDEPDLVRSMVIVNSGPAVVARTFQERMMIGSRILMTRLFSMPTIARTLAKRLFPHPGQERLRRTFVERWSENHKPSYAAALGAIIGWSVLDRIDRVACPTLVISGDRDYTPLARKQEYVSLMHNAELIEIADSGHATPIDQPAKFNEALLSFLSRVGKPA